MMVDAPESLSPHEVDAIGYTVQKMLEEAEKNKAPVFAVHNHYPKGWAAVGFGLNFSAGVVFMASLFAAVARLVNWIGGLF